MSYIITSPFPSFNDTDGSPLNNGYVYVGSANLNPVTDPIPVYWDEALTQPAAQPIRTINGYLSRNGSPGRIYTAFVTYSLRVTNNKGALVFSDLNYRDPSTSAGSTYQQVITAISGQTVFNLSRTYIPGTNNLFVYRNGLRLIVGQDYTETGYSQVTLTAGADNGDEFVFDIGYNYDSAASVDAQDVTYKLPAIDSVFTNVEAKLSETVSVKDFGAVGDGVTDDTAAIQAAIDYIESINGGVVQIPQGTFSISSTIEINSSVGVQLIGQGSDGIHDGGIGATAATEFLWSGPLGGTMLNVSSPSGASNSRQYGSSVVDIKLNCNSIAGIGLFVNSVMNGTFSRLYVQSPTIAAVKTTTLGNANLAEASDTQRCIFDRISYRCIDNAATRAAHGFWLTSHSPVGSTANTSLNYFNQCGGQSWGGAGSGYGLYIEDADNNTFMNFRAFRASGTTVEAVRLVGNTNCDANHFWNLSAGGLNSITIKGTASGFAINPTRNSFWTVDNTNGTQYPTADVGVIFNWHADTNAFVNQLFSKMVVADSVPQAISNFPNLSSASQYIYNSSSNHQILSDGTNRWSVAIDSATGDLRMARLAGTGAVNVGNGAPVKLFGKDVTVGIADSGGVGFRLLRVPN